MRIFRMEDFDAGIDELRTKQVDLMKKAETIQANADKKGRPLTETEGKQVDDLLAEFTVVKASIARKEAFAANSAHLETIQPRIATPLKASGEIVVEDRLKGKAGYESFGAFAIDARASIRGTVTDKFRRFVNAAPTSFGQEQVAADGGYAIPPDFRADIVNRIYAEDSLIQRTDQYTTAVNAITMPVDEVSAWNTVNGVQAFWQAEAAQFTTSKLKLQQQTIPLHKLIALCPLTDELLEDVAAMTGYLGQKVPQKFAWRINDVLINGTGLGQPLGLLNSPAAIQVAKEAGQVNGTIVLANVIKMFARRYIAQQANLVWLINQDCEAQLQQMVLAGTAVWPAYMPPGGISGAKYATLYGKPVMTFESCKALGTPGDIILADMSQYMTVLKSAGLRQDVSIHLWFDFDITAYRFTMRLGGQPWWTVPLARQNSALTLSPIITLAQR
jgi:HK97 family phage major capsid protein